MKKKEIKEILETNIINNINDLNNYIKHCKDYRLTEVYIIREIIVNTLIIAVQMNVINYVEYHKLLHAFGTLCDYDINSGNWRVYDL